MGNTVRIVTKTTYIILHKVQVYVGGAYSMDYSNLPTFAV